MTQRKHLKRLRRNVELLIISFWDVFNSKFCFFVCFSFVSSFFFLQRLTFIYYSKSWKKTNQIQRRDRTEKPMQLCFLLFYCSVPPKPPSTVKGHDESLVLQDWATEKKMHVLCFSGSFLSVVYSQHEPLPAHLTLLTPPTSIQPLLHAQSLPAVCAESQWLLLFLSADAAPFASRPGQLAKGNANSC